MNGEDPGGADHEVIQQRPRQRERKIVQNVPIAAEVFEHVADQQFAQRAVVRHPALRAERAQPEDAGDSATGRHSGLGKNDVAHRRLARNSLAEAAATRQRRPLTCVHDFPRSFLRTAPARTVCRGDPETRRGRRHPRLRPFSLRKRTRTEPDLPRGRVLR